MADDKPKPVLYVVSASLTDADAFNTYQRAVLASGLFDRFGATPLASGPVYEALEGDFTPADLTVVIEFPSAQAARAFWHSPEYREIATLRQGAGSFRAGLWRKIMPRC